MQNISVTVYTKPLNACAACLFTKKKLEALGIPATFVDVTQDDEAKAFVMGLGYTQTPVVVVDQNPAVHWSGHRDSRLESLV